MPGPNELDALAEDFERVFESLSRVELQRGASSLDSLELSDLFGPAGEGQFLGFYTPEGLEHAFAEYGFLDDLAEVGFPSIRIDVVTDDPDEHLMRIWSEDPKLDVPLTELVARRDILRPTHDLAREFGDPIIPVLTIEWLQMQNPLADFSPGRPPLPGQRHPGLGVGAQVLQLLRNACRRLDLEALVTVPAYFHNAVFYSEAFAYFDPSFQGRFLALARDVVPQAGASVGAASWALQWSMVTSDDEPEQPVEWFHDAMVAPVSKRLKDYFDSEIFHREVNRVLSAESYRLLDGALATQLASHGIEPFDLERIVHWIDSNS
jgi:hypothetical protein